MDNFSAALQHLREAHDKEVEGKIKDKPVFFLVSTLMVFPDICSTYVDTFELLRSYLSYYQSIHLSVAMYCCEDTFLAH